MKIHKRFIPLVVYIVIAMAIMLPWLRPGFILTMDMVFVPHMPMPETVGNTFVLMATFHYVTNVFPADILQKIMLFSVFVGAGLGMHNLWRTVAEKYSHSEAWLPYVAGFLYVANPFVYTRIMAGHYLVLLGYALLPFVLHALWRFWQVPSWRRAGFVLLWCVVMGMVSIHGLGIAVLACAIFTGLYMFSYRAGPAFIGAALVKLAAVGVGFVVLSSYWLLPTLRGTSTMSQTIASFTSQDAQAFATIGGSAAGRLVNVLGLQGFWQDNRYLYTLPQEQMPLWSMAMLVVWLLVFVGIVRLWKLRRLYAAFFSATIVIAAVLAAGIGHAWMSTHLPFFAGYREPQKFTALIALSYAALVPFGAATLLRRIQYSRPTFFVFARGVVCVLPVLLAMPLFWGCAGQLAPRHYPADWFAADKYLSAHAKNAYVLSLPWHQYTTYEFAERLIANPTPPFFKEQIISSKDPEIEGASLETTATAKQRLGRQFTPDAPHPAHLGAQLAEERVKYVMVAKEYEYSDYTYLAAQPYLQKVFDSPSIIIYKNTVYQGE